MINSSILLPADPKANYLAHKSEIDEAVKRVLEHGWYILGEEVSGFESEFARFIGAAHAIGVGSGTEALHLALRACGIGSGDIVVTASQTAVATVAAIELSGARPLLLDIDPSTYVMDVNQLSDVIKKAMKLPAAQRPRAIIPVHLYGHPVNMDAVMEIATEFEMYVIEDCAQSHGATWNGRLTGSMGHFGAFSFYPTKNLGALGDAGALVTSDPSLADKASLLRQYGWRERYVSEVTGMNTRLDELQAAVLRVKLRSLKMENGRRRDIAETYKRLLEGAGLILPHNKGNVIHAYHQFVIRNPMRDSLKSFLQEHGIGSAILYPFAVHQQPAYRHRHLTATEMLPNTEAACREILCLPIHPQLDNEQVNSVAQTVNRWANQKGK